MSLIHMNGAMARRVILVLAVASTLATPAWASPQQPTTVSARGCGNCKMSRDSVRARREKLLMKIDSLRWEFDHNRLSPTDRERLAQEMTSTVLALQASLDQSMRANAAVVAMTEAEAAEYREEMRLLARTPGAVTVQSGGGFRRTRGYLGVTFDGAMIELSRNDERIIRFYQYPKIALVEPSSPAERAGIHEGDTLLALNGNDVREGEISFTKLLVPDARITMRVRREGNAKNLKVIVGEAPDYYMSRVAPLAPMARRLPMPPMPPMPPMASTAPMEPGQVRARVPMVWGPDMPPPAMAGSVWIVNEGIAGAKVETLSEGLGKAFGAKSGVLILKAAPGTPAYRSGLRDGDVVLRASGEPVSSVRELRGMLQEGDREAGVKLVILRERKQRDVTLRW